MQYLYQFVFYLLANRALMAGAGENGVAIFNVLQNLSYLVLYLYDGAAKAAQPLVSTYAAERYRAGSRSTLTLALATGNGLGILLCLALSLAAPAVCGVFGLTEPSAVAAGAAAVRIYCLGLVLGGTNQMLEGYDQARGLEKRSLLLATLRGAAVLLPGTALFALLPVSRFWWLFPAVELVSLGLFALLAPPPGARTRPERGGAGPDHLLQQSGYRCPDPPGPGLLRRPWGRCRPAVFCRDDGGRNLPGRHGTSLCPPAGRHRPGHGGGRPGRRLCAAFPG